MPEDLADFLQSPAATPLPRSAAAGVGARAGDVQVALSEVLGVPRTTLVRSGRLPLNRSLFVLTADAAPACVQPTLLHVQPRHITASGLSFVHQREFPVRRLIIEIGPPPAGELGRSGRFVATVLGSLRQRDRLHLTAIRFQGVADDEA